MPTSIDSTVQLLKDKLTEAAATQGLQMISSWEADLQGATFSGAAGIASELALLRQALESGTADGPAIGQMLVSLGGSTQQAAVSAEASQSASLGNLAQALMTAGQQLGASA